MHSAQVSCQKKPPFRATFPAVFFAIALGLFAGACAKDTDPGGNESDETFSELVASTLSGSVASVSGGNSAAFVQPQPLRSLYAIIEGWLTPFPQALATAACPRFTDSRCTSPELMESVYQKCQFIGPDGNFTRATWDGAQLMRFSHGAKCGQAPYTSGSVTRYFRPGTWRLAPNGVKITFDSENHKGWHHAVAGGTTINFAAAGTHRLVINGMHYLGVKSHKTHLNSDITNATIDHTLSTLAPIETQLVDGYRVLISGTMQTQNNRDHSLGTSQITKPLTMSASCCHPIAGQITTELSGSKSGTEVLTFSNQCSTADLTDTNGITRQILLSHCL
ncbi:MAG: hypothetical protein HY074_07280 [Deltaproteobacteria bacterium]|nr:hypothetical protein [Deltaproteobacteria bacterium]